jgi:hypothetical protein
MIVLVLDLLLEVQQLLVLPDPPVDLLRLPFRRARAGQARLGIGRPSQRQEKA